MATALKPGGHEEGFGATQRKDAWWLGPAVTFLVLSGFLVYGTWAAFQNGHYWVGGDPDKFGGYLSPFYSPPLFVDAADLDRADTVPASHVWLGEWPRWLKSIWPPFVPYSPGFLILVFPGAFRFTCYYYRKAYYRSFGLSPPGCAVPGPKRPWRYAGETRLFLVQNLHRYALYFAVAFIFILGWDAFLSYFRDGVFGVGVGSLVLTVNVLLLSAYTFGCHSWRHLVGGRLNCFTCDGAVRSRHGIWKKVTWLNERHQLFAWTSLFWVAFSDVYIRLVSSGVIHDLNTWGGH
jgi:hypothetical protein